MRKSFVSLCTAAVLMISSSAFAEKVANPTYDMWSKFKVGASAKLATDATAAGMNSKLTTTTKLVELTPEKAVIETVTTMDMGGTKMEMPAQKTEIPAQIEKAAETPAAAGEKPKSESGEEDVKVGDKTIKAKWTTVTTTQNGMTINAKTWTSPEVPGGMVKMSSKTEGAVASNTEMVLLEFSDGK